MQINLGNGISDNRRVDFYGNATEGVFVELVDENGLSYFFKQITETERLMLVGILTRKDNGKAV